MLPSPSSSPSRVFDDHTNTPKRARPSSPTPFSKNATLLPTPPFSGRKPIANAVHTSPTKRRRVIPEKVEEEDELDDESSSEEEEDDEDFFMSDVARPTTRPSGVFRMLDSAYSSRPGSFFQRTQLSTLPILRSFVSSEKTDVYRFTAVESDDTFTPAYVCAYSNGSKQGSSRQQLAVATEEGSVHIVDTAKRNPWDDAPSRTVFAHHDNGIFDIKWSDDDNRIVTVSGDQTARITDITTGRPTHRLLGHSSTVKCVSWDPSHPQLMSTGGRDGTICIWDLRLAGAMVQGDTSEEEALDPVIAIGGAHEERGGKRKRARSGPSARSVTAVVYSQQNSNHIVSSGTFDGILHAWDIRLPKSRRKSTASKPTKPKTYLPIMSTSIDPTTLGNARRARGIASMTVNPVDPDTLYALGADSRIHKYSMSTLTAYQDSPYASHSYTHPNLVGNSFYLRLAMSPCGRWLATGRAAGAQSQAALGNIFLFDTAGPSREGVVLCGVQSGEVGGLDWAGNATLAACGDDGTVRVWRQDQEQWERCMDDPVDNEHLWSWVKDS